MRSCWYLCAVVAVSAAAAANITELHVASPELHVASPELHRGTAVTATRHAEALANHAFDPGRYPAAPSSLLEEGPPTYRTAAASRPFSAAATHPFSAAATRPFSAAGRQADLQASESTDYPYAFQGHPADNHAIGYAAHGEHFSHVPQGDHFSPVPHGDHFSPFNHGLDHHGGREHLEGHEGPHRYKSDIAMGLIGFLIVLSTLQTGLITLSKQTSLLEALHGRKRRDTEQQLYGSNKVHGDHQWLLLEDSELRCAQRRTCEANRRLVTRYGLTGRRRYTRPGSAPATTDPSSSGDVLRPAARDGFRSDVAAATTSRPQTSSERPARSDWARLVQDAGMAGLRGEDCAALYRGCRDDRHLRGT